MEPVKVKKGSWHRWLAVNAGGLDPYGSTDICSYTRAALFGVVKLAFAAFALTWCAGVPLFGFLWSAFHMFHMHGAPWYAVLGLYLTMFYAGLALIFFTISSIRDWYYDEDRVEAKANKAPGFVKTAYRAFKDKVCFKILFE